MGLANIASDILFTTKRYKPEIKFILGVVSLGAALYTTHRAALKSQEIIEKRKKDLEKVEEAKEMVKKGEVEPKDYSEADAKNDTAKINVEFGFRMVKNYTLPAGCAMAAVALFGGAMGDYKNLFVLTGTAYNAFVMKHNEEMQYIKEKLGEEKFNELKTGFSEEQVKKAKDKQTGHSKCNPYSRWFDELHGAWRDDPEYNKMWLLGKQNFLDAKLQRNGHLFLNDAYDELGFPPTDAGRNMGWIRDNPDGTTNHVDFGIFGVHDEAARWFVNGIEPVFLIDFNVDPLPITGRIGWAKR